MFHESLEVAFGCERQKALRRSPRGAEIERRARFDYDDLLGLFSF
jgi:hypothetical protein